ncbi:hypothetical protein IAI10_06810 [Clostridium sp. 19966]|uniref:hypothetical protein n=1 Tax=Clostridium sp. 19966 TaxID=2768166 RepID=UPI0028DF6A95|nr:hypothetical protein [Clostridium sp. 19966]MDT8716363.1 hypothetical protein [Clostridium sp. 19966]
MIDSKLTFSDIYKMSTYEISKRFLYLGEGISRKVFAINDKYVIKIAKGMEGLYQNKVELYVFKHCGEKYKKYLCPIIWHKPDMLVMPRAVPLKSIDSSLKKVNLKNIRNEEEAYSDIMRLTRNFLLLKDDIESASSWGKIDGTAILIDYGCTSEEGDEFYNDL